jgi:hypothetical protein
VKRLAGPGLCLLALLAACGGGAGDQSANDANSAAEEGIDLNLAISGDELSPIPEAEDDMIANQAGSANLAGNQSGSGDPAAQGGQRPPGR